MVKTVKPKKKDRTNLRVTNDDSRRYKEFWAVLHSLGSKYQPYAVGVEAYRMMPGGSAAAAKTMGVYVGIQFWGWTRGMYVAPFLPNDLKKRFCGKQSASKFAVEQAICQEIYGLAELLSSIAKGQREHVADASGHAVLMLEDVDRLRQMLGV